MTLTAPVGSQVASPRHRASPLEVLPLCLVLGYAALGLLPLGDPDVWWHLRTGELVLEEGFARTDPWSWTSTEPWLLHEWLSEVVMYLSYLAGGYHGVIVLRSAMLALIATLILRSCRREAGTIVCFVVGLLTLVALFPSGGERPQLVSFALLAVMLPRLRDAVERRRPPWELVPVIWVWANLHLLWSAALVLYGALVVGLLVELGWREWKAARPFVGVGLLSGVAAGLTPNGPALLLIPLKAGDAPQFISEFSPPNLHRPFTFSAMILLAIVVVGWARASHPVKASEIAFVLAVTFVGLSYARTVPILAIGVAPLAARTLQRLATRPVARPSASRANIALTSALVTIFTVLAALWLPHVPGVKPGAPYATPRYLDALPGRAKVINEYELGGWLLWTARDTSPGVDGRAETKSLPFLAAYLNALKLQGDWRAFVNESGADAAWLRKEAPLVHGLQSMGWRTVREDDFTYVLVPPDEGTAG